MFKAHMKITVHKSSAEANFRSKPEQLQMTEEEKEEQVHLEISCAVCLIDLMELVKQNKDTERTLNNKKESKHESNVNSQSALK